MSMRGTNEHGAHHRPTSDWSGPALPAAQPDRSPHRESYAPLRGSERRGQVWRSATTRYVTALVVRILLPPLAFLAAACVAHAQQPSKAPQIGFLATGSPAETAIRLEAFRQGLRDLGYVE